MSITGSQLVQDALFACGSYGVGDNLADADAQLVLRRLNRMLDSWTNERAMIFGIARDSFTMSPGVADYSTTLLTTIGRPVQVLTIVTTLNNVWYGCDMISDDAFQKIPYKLTQSIPEQCYYDEAYPNAQFHFYPIPFAAFTCYISAVTPLTSTVTLSTVLALPQGYEKAIVDSLAVDIAPSFGQQITAQMDRDATNSRAVIKRNNYVSPVMDTPFIIRYDPSNGFIYRGF
jgi:hypothetical protein